MPTWRHRQTLARVGSMNPGWPKRIGYRHYRVMSWNAQRSVSANTEARIRIRDLGRALSTRG